MNISSRRIQPPTHTNVDYIIEIGLRQWKRCVLPVLFTGTYDNYFADGSAHQVRNGLWLVAKTNHAQQQKYAQIESEMENANKTIANSK